MTDGWSAANAEAMAADYYQHTLISWRCAIGGTPCEP